MSEERPPLHIPGSRSRAEYEAELASGDVERISVALIDSSYEEDAAWVQARCLEGLTSPHTSVRSGALIALQVLTAVRGEIDPIAVVPALASLLHDSDAYIAQQARDVLDDLKNFLGQ